MHRSGDLPMGGTKRLLRFNLDSVEQPAKSPVSDKELHCYRGQDRGREYVGVTSQRIPSAA